MQIRVLLFAQVREIVGSDSVEIAIEEQSVTPLAIRQKVAQVADADQDLTALLERCMVAIDNEYCMDVNQEFAVKESMELAIIPPISGG